MKKCIYCGTEYPDEVVRCPIDQELLSGGPPPPDEVILEGSPTDGISDPVITGSTPPATLKDQQLRVFELVLVCVVAFGGSVLTSGYYLFYPMNSRSSVGTFHWISTGLHEVAALALLLYVLHRRSKSFRDLTRRWSVKDIGISFILWIATGFAFNAVYFLIYFTRQTSVSRSHASISVGQHLFGGGISLAAFLFQFLNPFFEELIVRAYVMTEIKDITNSAVKAILISTALQTSYHFYQGAPLAFSEGAVFLIFSIYYAKTNRIAPVILAHLYADVTATLYFWIKHA